MQINKIVQRVEPRVIPPLLDASRTAWQGKLALTTISESVPNGITWSWFDIPNPWWTDKSGFLFYSFNANGTSDIAVTINDIGVREIHVADHLREYRGSIWVPQGAKVGFSIGNTASLDYWRFMRE